MMDHDRALSAFGSSAYPAAIAVSSEHLFPQTTKIFLILPLKRIAGSAHSERENLTPSATAVERPLDSCPDLFHFSLPFPFKKSFSLSQDEPRATTSTNPSSTRARVKPATNHSLRYRLSQPIAYVFGHPGSLMPQPLAPFYRPATEA